MNENLLLIAVTVASMLWLALPAPTAIAQSWPVVKTFPERPQAAQVQLSRQERLQRQWQRTVDKAYAQSAILRAWQERVVRSKQASTNASTRSRTAKLLRVTKVRR